MGMPTVRAKMKDFIAASRDWSSVVDDMGWDPYSLMERSDGEDYLEIPIDICDRHGIIKGLIKRFGG